jgi:hypothetical protein
MIVAMNQNVLVSTMIYPLIIIVAFYSSVMFTKIEWVTCACCG